uniref:Uncharacterized protein n=1 Tax=Arundo donax TaxID=35708 RepID=A0A0A9D8E3_ARUDO
MPAAARCWSADRSRTWSSGMEPGQPMQTSVKAPSGPTIPWRVME